MKSIPDNVLSKIKKCLALAGSSNEHEAAAAMRQAKALMDKYQVSDSDVALSDVSESESKLNQSRRFPSHVMRLMRIVSSIMGCRHFISQDLYTSSVVFIGTSPNDELASYAFSALNRQMIKARKQFIKDNCKRVRRRNEKTRRADVFCAGWILSISKSVASLRVDVPEIVGKYMESEHNELFKVSARKLNIKGSNRDFGIWGQGVESGKDVNLNKPMTGESRKALQ